MTLWSDTVAMTMWVQIVWDEIGFPIQSKSDMANLGLTTQRWMSGAMAANTVALVG